MGTLHFHKILLVLFGYLGLGLVLAHGAQENQLRLVFLDELSLKADALRMVPITLVLALDVLLIVVLAEAETEPLLPIPWLLSHH